AAVSATTALIAGDTLTVTLTVQNTGDATALAVTPTISRTVTGTVTLTVVSSPAAQPISGGATATFQWVYQTAASDNGSVVFNASASGTDANSGATVSSATVSTPSVPVLAPASAGLSSSLAVAPRVAAPGEP